MSKDTIIAEIANIDEVPPLEEIAKCCTARGEEIKSTQRDALIARLTADAKSIGFNDLHELIRHAPGSGKRGRPRKSNGSAHA